MKSLEGFLAICIFVYFVLLSSLLGLGEKSVPLIVFFKMYEIYVDLLQNFLRFTWIKFTLYAYCILHLIFDDFGKWLPPRALHRIIVTRPPKEFFLMLYFSYFVPMEDHFIIYKLVFIIHYWVLNADDSISTIHNNIIINECLQSF